MRILTRRERAARNRSGTEGQSLVEFSLVLTPLLLILLGIVQFGFIFNSYITIANATREGARDGSIYVYQQGQSKAQNDAARNAAIRTTIQNSMNLLSPSAPWFTTTGTWSQTGDTFTNGDLTVTYALPTGISQSDARVGQTVTVRVRYHQDLLIPLISALLPRDAGGRLVLTGEVTMVIN
ncbi:MAG: pilus assembly protein [Chloroflexota bacterium]|nr:MAG: pilus assembly protein [Chloroflexota bacterium]